MQREMSDELKKALAEFNANPPRGTNRYELPHATEIPFTLPVGTEVIEVVPGSVRLNDKGEVVELRITDGVRSEAFRPLQRFQQTEWGLLRWPTWSKQVGPHVRWVDEGYQTVVPYLYPDEVEDSAA